MSDDTEFNQQFCLALARVQTEFGQNLHSRLRAQWLLAFTACLFKPEELMRALFETPRANIQNQTLMAYATSSDVNCGRATRNAEEIIGMEVYHG